MNSYCLQYLNDYMSHVEDLSGMTVWYDSYGMIMV